MQGGQYQFYLILEIFYCQARVPGLTYRMVKHLREKLISHRESQKGTRADAIIQIHPPTTTTITFQTNWIFSMSQNSDCYDAPICQDTLVCQDTKIF